MTVWQDALRRAEQSLLAILILQADVCKFGNFFNQSFKNGNEVLPLHLPFDAHNLFESLLLSLRILKASLQGVQLAIHKNDPLLDRSFLQKSWIRLATEVKTSVGLDWVSSIALCAWLWAARRVVRMFCKNKEDCFTFQDTFRETRDRSRWRQRSPPRTGAGCRLSRWYSLPSGFGKNSRFEFSGTGLNQWRHKCR